MSDNAGTRQTAIVIHCGVFFALYFMFLMTVPRTDFQEATRQALAGKNAEQVLNILIALKTFCAAGYVGLWMQRKWGLAVVAVGALCLLAYGGLYLGFWSAIYFIPLVAAITVAPLWPLLK